MHRAWLSFLSPWAALYNFVTLYGILALMIGIMQTLKRAALTRFLRSPPVSSIVSSVAASAQHHYWHANDRNCPLGFIVHRLSWLSNLGLLRVAPATSRFGLHWRSSTWHGLGMTLLFQNTLSYLVIAYIIASHFVIMGVGNIVLAFSRFSKTE